MNADGIIASLYGSPQLREEVRLRQQQVERLSQRAVAATGKEKSLQRETAAAQSEALKWRSRGEELEAELKEALDRLDRADCPKYYQLQAEHEGMWSLLRVGSVKKCSLLVDVRRTAALKSKHEETLEEKRSTEENLAKQISDLEAAQKRVSMRGGRIRVAPCQ